jgi:hypothetical protein
METKGEAESRAQHFRRLVKIGGQVAASDARSLPIGVIKITLCVKAGRVVSTGAISAARMAY